MLPYNDRMYSVGDVFPSFTLQGVTSENQITEVSLVEEPTSWSVVYFYPKDFTFICPTEIAGMDILTSEANVIGISVEYHQSFRCFLSMQVYKIHYHH